MVNILKNIYSAEPAFLIDNHKCKYSDNIYDISYLSEINTDDYVLFLTSVNLDIYSELKNTASEYFPSDRIIELESMRFRFPEWKTEIGRYSYGPICRNHQLIKSIGAFCSFGPYTEYVGNHENRYLTTHPIIFGGKDIEGYEFPFALFQRREFYIDGIEPKTEYVQKLKRAVIGNDVWFGQNVLVTNSANIGNGVIAGAGAVITKDVPDYAVVAGAPARIIRYRYTPWQIEMLNKIAWWDWTDEEIRERFNDFYLPIDEFIEKYKETIS